MGGPFMVEIVFCRVTRRGRKKKAGMNKLARENCRNDGPMGGGFVPPDTLKITLDLSDSGPVFSALDEMMMKMMEDDEKRESSGKGGNAEAKNALKKLLKSGIPGIEAMFGGEDPKPRFGKGGGKKGFHKMTDASKKKFMQAIFGEEGTQIDSSTAAALLAACCSNGNPDIGNQLAELLMPELDEKVDPAMMAALMAACSMIQTGASTEEVLNIMKLELAASGLTEEEILQKAQLLMKAFGKEEAGSTAEYMLMSKQMNSALNQAGLPPKDFTAVRCSLEDVADNMISSLAARGEKTGSIIGKVTETLQKTGATAHVVASTLMPPLAEMTGEKETALVRIIGRNLKEVEFDGEDVKSACTDLVLKIIENDPPAYVDAVKSLEDTLKDMGEFSTSIQEYIKANIPSPPTPPEEIERRALMAAELARLEEEEKTRERMNALKEADPKAYDKEMKARLKELAESDPEAYEREMKNLGKSELDRLISIKSESRRGSLLGANRSRAGSMVAMGGRDQSRRGSYFDEATGERKRGDRATVAMVTDDPDHKAALKQGLAGAFGEDGSATNGYENEEGSGPTGALPAGTKVETGPGGVVMVGGKPLPPGATVVTNPDGSISVSVSKADEELVAKMMSAGMSESDVRQMLAASGGKISPESRALMEQILASGASAEEIASRVDAMLTATASADEGGLYEESNMADARASYLNEHEDGLRRPGEPGGLSLLDKIKMRNAEKGARGSVKRQSEIQREKKKSRQEEREEEKLRKQSYYRKVTGLRRAKVPMMVYSCGGFSRCFRVCRFYDVEGPPVGVEYEAAKGEADSRRDLNPDL